MGSPQKVLKIHTGDSPMGDNRRQMVGTDYDPRYSSSPHTWAAEMKDVDIRKVQLVACDNAKDKDEARQFLEMLGFVKYKSGNTRWAKKGEQRVRRQLTPEEREAKATKMQETKARNKAANDALFNQMTNG